MAKEVLLMTNIPDLGSEGDVVTVADGYARNYLLPRDLAAPVTEQTRRRLAKLQREREEADRSALAEARKFAAKLAKVSCTLAVKVGKDEKMYGSVTTTEISEALKLQGTEIDRHNLVLENPIKDLGVFNIPVRLHPEVEATIKVWVVEE